MKRIEIIANQSVREELIDGLESAITDLEYTILPTVHGKGLSKRKEGTRTWPETNFLLISYMDEGSAAQAKSVLATLLRRFPDEGIWACVSDAESLT